MLFHGVCYSPNLDNVEVGKGREKVDLLPQQSGNLVKCLDSFVQECRLTENDSVLSVFLTVCPNGITNIKASSGVLAYPSSGDYGINETKCWKIEVPDTYKGIYYSFNKYVFLFLRVPSYLKRRCCIFSPNS